MKLLVIDGNSIANRCFYGIRPLSNKKGVFTHATTGFFNTYLKLVKKFQPDGVAVAFDLRAPTFRAKLYDGYKAGRKGMPDELAAQMPHIKSILTLLGIKVLECEGFEADDILGTLAAEADRSGNFCIIATGDRDAFQLVSENVWVDLAKTTEDITYTPETIRELYGLSPKQMIEVKALMGDSSDNIPGVKGIGEKTALGLIQKYGSIDYLYEHIAGIDVTTSVRKKLEDGKEMCYISRELGTIRTDAPVSIALADYRLGGRDEAGLAATLSELEIFSLMKRLGVDPALAAAPASEPAAPEAVAGAVLEAAVMVMELGGELWTARQGRAERLDEAQYADFFGSDEKKHTFNVKALWRLALEKGFTIKNVIFDTTLAAYLLNVNASEYTLERLCAEYGVEYAGGEQGFAALSALNRALYSRVCGEEMLSVLTDIELPLAEVLSSMEHEGIRLDIDGVKQFGEELMREIEVIEAGIYEQAGVRFNISSPKQLGEVLFERLMLPTGKKTKSGYSTNADVLEFLMDKHPIVPMISEYRALTKLNSTYVAGLLKVVSESGIIHTTYKQTETRTGRISSAEPNIQNIPVRTPRGRRMRSFFTAREGMKLVDADYSQIELRVLAHISGDEIMQKAFLSGDDIHAITASQVFNQPPEWVTPEMRSAAKAVNFGIVYGIGAFSLSKDIGVSVAEADTYIKSYLEKYHKVRAYMEGCFEEAKKHGWVATMLGRRRYIPEVNSTNKNISALGRRMAMNTPIQGTAADIIKIAMVNVYKSLRERGLRSRLILQVHDELIIEAPEDEVEAVTALLKEQMEAAVKLVIPLTVEVKSGDTWYDTH